MASDPAVPGAGPILDLIEAFRRSKTMFTAVALEVFDRLEDRPATASALARELGTDPEALARLLDGCVGLGLLTREGDRYALTPVAAAYLCRSSPHSLVGYIVYSNDALDALWGRLEDAVREGTHRWRQVFGAEGPIFAHFFRTEESTRDFIAGMHGFGLLSSPLVVAAVDLGPYRRLVDLGGASGHLARAARARYPELNVAVFDLPEVIGRARRERERTGSVDRVELIDGDFIRDPLPEADLYALGRILHDWSEEKIRLLLAKVFAHLPEGGALLVAEKVVDEDRAGPMAALMQSLNMLVCTEGRERTESEYRALLVEAGFTEVTCRRTAAPVDAILALKR
jgi:acetylserotonin N-methyltransferase